LVSSGAVGVWDRFTRRLFSSSLQIRLARQVPVFAISGERYERPDPNEGFAGFFLKPIELDVLVAALARLRRRGV
jgi:hypothetical protein